MYTAGTQTSLRDGKATSHLQQALLAADQPAITR